MFRSSRHSPAAFLGLALVLLVFSGAVCPDDDRIAATGTVRYQDLEGGFYGIVTDESMGSAVKVTVIATGFQRGPRKAAPTPVDLANFMSTPQPQAQQQAAASGEGFYRKTPNAKAASGGGGRFDLDVPAFLRRKGAGEAPSE